jgi:hypothetical protein
LTEDDVLAIKMREGIKSDEELRTIGAWASISHGEETWTGVLVLEVFVSELGTIDGLTSSTVASSEITTLSHETSNESVELGALVVKRLARLTNTLLTSAESSEVFRGNWGISVEIERNSASRLTANSNVKENFRVCHLNLVEDILFINR